MHNKLPVKERLFRVGLSNDPYCNFCPSAEICDVEHFFCACGRVNAIWCRIKDILASMVKDKIFAILNLLKNLDLEKNLHFCDLCHIFKPCLYFLIEKISPKSTFYASKVKVQSYGV